MRVLHAAAWARPPVGVVHQMEAEQRAANELALSWRTRIFCPQGALPDSPVGIARGPALKPTVGGTAARLRSRLHLLSEYYRWLRQEQEQTDLLLLRYRAYDPLQAAFVMGSRRPIALVHHTLEGPELASGGAVGQALSLLDGASGAMTLRSASAIVGVTREILAYESARLGGSGKPTFLYPNGIDWTGSRADDARGEVVELLFVASEFAPWHGLDRLLDSMRVSPLRCVLHVVGEVGEADRRSASNDARVVLHGRLGSERIRELAGRSVLGLSSFALERKSMFEACTLKVREYLMLGLPVYAGYREVLPREFRFYRQGPADLETILSYAQQVRPVGRETVAAAAREHVEKKSLLGALVSSLTECFGARSKQR